MILTVRKIMNFSFRENKVANDRKFVIKKRKKKRRNFFCKFVDKNESMKRQKLLPQKLLQI